MQYSIFGFSGLSSAAVCLSCMWYEWLRMCEFSTAGIHQQARRPAAQRRHHANLYRAPTTDSSKTLNQKGHSPPLGPAWKGSCWPMLCSLAARQKITQIGPLYTTLHCEDIGEGGLWYNLHFLAGDWGFGDMVDGDVSCCGLISLLVFTVTADGCLSSPQKQGSACHFPAEVDSLCWMNVRGKLL